MAQLFSTGPVDIWLQWDAGNPTFLGHGTRAPQLSTNPALVPVTCDLTGGVPIDEVYGSETHDVTVELVRFNMAPLARLQSRASTMVLPATGINSRGSNPPGRIGTLLVAEGAAPRLFLRFPYASKAAFGTMQAGYRFFAAILRPDRSTFGAADAMKVSLSWTCLPVLTTENSNTLGSLGTASYDHNLTAIAGSAID